MTTHHTELAAILARLAQLLAQQPGPPATPEPAPSLPPRVLLTVDEAAARLGIGKTKAYELVRSGALESVRIGRLRRIHVEAITKVRRRPRGRTANSPVPSRLGASHVNTSQTQRTRNSNGRSSIYYSDRDQSWHGWVTVGSKDNGRPDRRHVRGKTKAVVTKKVRELERQRDDGAVRKAGQTWTVAQWLHHWLHTIVAPPIITENAWSAYDVAVRCHLTPGVGAHRLDRLEPEHLERLYRKMVKAGAKPATAHQVHRTIRTALNEALKRQHITRNIATIARAPKVREDEIEPYSVDEVRRILNAAQQRRNTARWAIALALGLRQGEALGLRACS